MKRWKVVVTSRHWASSIHTPPWIWVRVYRWRWTARLAAFWATIPTTSPVLHWAEVLQITDGNVVPFSRRR